MAEEKDDIANVDDVKAKQNLGKLRDTNFGDLENLENDANTEDKPSFNTVLEPTPEIPAAPSLGRGFVVSGFVLASLLGGSLGVAGSQLLKGSDKTSALRTEMTQDLAEMKSTLMKASDSQDESWHKKLVTSQAARNETEARLTELETQNENLTEHIAALSQELTAVKSAQIAPIDVPDIPNDVQAASDNTSDAVIEASAIPELESAETKNAEPYPDTALNSDTDAIADQPMSDNEVLDMSVVSGADADLEVSASDSDIDIKPEPDLTAPQSNQDMALSDKQDVSGASQDETIEAEIEISDAPIITSAQNPAQTLEDLIASFPRGKLTAAIRAQEKLSNEKPSWLKRTLSKHIRVGNDDVPDPHKIIEAAQAALEAGQVTEALTQIAKLNPPVRTSAADWILAAKKVAPLIEQEQ